MERFQGLKEMIEQARLSKIMEGQKEKSYSFETFRADSDNFLAYASCLEIVEKEDCTNGLLYIYGAEKTGKSHLLKAVRNHMEEKCPDKSVKYLNADAFTADIIWDFCNVGNVTALKEKYRTLDVLLLDDIHYLCDKPRVLKVFYDILEIMLMEKKQIIVTANCLPDQLDGMEDKLIIRLASGEIVEIKK